MSKTYQYFSIPYDTALKNQLPSCTVWFASWSTTLPIVDPNTPGPVVVGCTDSELPAGAIALGTGSKDPPPPPPLLATTDMSAYQASVNAWLNATRDADE